MKKRTVIRKCQTPGCSSVSKLRVIGHEGLEDKPFLCGRCEIRRRLTMEEKNAMVNANVKAHLAEKERQ